VHAEDNFSFDKPPKKTKIHGQMKNKNNENKDIREIVYLEKTASNLVQWFAQNLPLKFLVKNALYHFQMVKRFYFFRIF